MGLFKFIKHTLLGGGPPNGEALRFNPELFVYLKIPGAIGPTDRGATYADPLAELLAAEGAGEVSGGGTLLARERPDGTRPIEFCGIDIDVTDLPKALGLLREALPTLGAPLGTELQYTQAGKRLYDTLMTDGWHTGLLRTSSHPGFSV